MKKIISVFLLLASLFLLTGCNSHSTTEGEDTPYFIGKVTVEYKDSCLVEVVSSGNGNFSQGTEVEVSTTVSGAPKIKVGDYIKICFDGKVAYSLPPKVLNVLSIIKIKN
jgi:hypothetical protein